VTVIPVSTQPEPNPSMQGTAKTTGESAKPHVAESSASEATSSFAALIPSMAIKHSRDAQRKPADATTSMGASKKKPTTATGHQTVPAVNPATSMMVTPAVADSSGELPGLAIPGTPPLHSQPASGDPGASHAMGAKHIADPSVGRREASTRSPTNPMIEHGKNTRETTSAQVSTASQGSAHPSKDSASSLPVAKSESRAPSPPATPVSPYVPSGKATSPSSAPTTVIPDRAVPTHKVTRNPSSVSPAPRPSERNSEQIVANAKEPIASTRSRPVSLGQDPQARPTALKASVPTSVKSASSIAPAGQSEPSSATIRGQVSASRPTTVPPAGSSRVDMSPSIPKSIAPHPGSELPPSSPTEEASHRPMPTGERQARTTTESIGQSHGSLVPEQTDPSTPRESVAVPSRLTPPSVGEPPSESITSELPGTHLRPHAAAKYSAEESAKSGATRGQGPIVPTNSSAETAAKPTEPLTVQSPIGPEPPTKITESSQSTASKASPQTVTSPRSERETLPKGSFPKAFTLPSGHAESVHAGSHSHGGSGMPADNSTATPTEPSTTTSPTTAGPAPTTASGHTPSDAMTMGPNAEWHVAQQQQPGQTILTAQHRQDAEPVRAEITDHTVNVVTPANGAPWQQSLDQHTATLQAALHQWGSGQQAHIQADVRGQSESQPRTPAAPSPAGPSSSGSRRAAEGLSESHSSYVEERPLDSTIHWQSPA